MIDSFYSKNNYKCDFYKMDWRYLSNKQIDLRYLQIQFPNASFLCVTWCDHGPVIERS